MMNVVLSFGVNTKNFSVWSNESIQSVFFLFLLLENIPDINVHIVNFGTPIDDLKSDITFNINDINFTEWDDIKSDIDIFIQTNSDIDSSCLEYLKNNKTKIINYVTTNQYFNDIDKILQNSSSDFRFFQYDSIWIQQHQININKSYLETIFNCDVQIIPFIWNSIFIDTYIPQLEQNGLEFGYKNHDKPKNITIFEPNNNHFKTALLPILIAEKAYNVTPELVSTVKVLNTKILKKSNYFMSIINNLNLMKDSKLILDDRYNTPYILSRYTDIVLSHQFESDLNFIYFDSLYGNYPLVHNSYMIKQCGYYYGGFNIDSAASCLLSSLSGDNTPIKNKNRELLLKNVDVYNVKNIDVIWKKLTMLF